MYVYCRKKEEYLVCHIRKIKIERRKIEMYLYLRKKKLLKFNLPMPDKVF